MAPVAAATELVPIPTTGRLYTATSTVRMGDADTQGRVRLDGLARHLQDVANDDAVASGLTNAVAWVVRRTLILIDRVPTLGENLSLTTFCSGTGRSWAERRTSISGDRGGSVEAVSLWVQVDAATDRIRALGDEFHEIYGEAAGGRRVSARLSLPGPPAEMDVAPWPIRAVDLDVLGHVNNAAQWAILEEALVGVASDRHGVAEIEHLAPIDAADSPATLSVAGSDACTAWLFVHDSLCAAAQWTPRGVILGADPCGTRHDLRPEGGAGRVSRRFASDVSEDGDGEVGAVVPRPQVPGREAMLDAETGLDDTRIETVEGELRTRPEPGEDETLGHDMGGDPAQHVRLGARRQEDHHVSGQQRGGERLGLAHRRQVELGEVGDQPSGPRVVGPRCPDQAGVGIDPDDTVTPVVEDCTDASCPTAGVEHP